MKETGGKLRSIYGSFKSIADDLDSTTISPKFWRKQSKNILKVIAEDRKMKEAMKMSPEKFRQEFTI